MKNITAYFKPTSIKEAVALLREHPGKGRFIAGGTNIVVAKDPTLDYLVDVHQLGLDYIREDGDLICIGAAATIETLYHSALANILAAGLFAQIASWFAGKQIRNVATIGGNVAEGLSGADTIPALLALDAEAVVVGDTQRIAPVADLLNPTGGARLQDELLTEFRISKAFQSARGAFLKNAKTREDISIVSVTTVVTMDGPRCRNARIALGAVAPTAVRVPPAERLLHDQIPTPELIAHVADAVVERIHPIDNFRATAAYRREISRVYTRRALSACCGLQKLQE
jgi:aerobic carbon-monoxide dehydrogenase medium subunit